ncbi:MAG: sugar ABC transporter permease [Oceanococcus sp.]|nr:MAG: sugar ABC transporter permease [Oceanococcus sp.]
MKLIPLALALGLLVFAPLLMTLALGLFSFDGLAAPQWLGWAAYQRMLDDALFQQSLRNSLLIAALSIPLRLLLALGLSLLLQRPGRASRAALLISLLPVVVPTLVWATAWLWLLNPHFGPIAAALDSWRVNGASWLLSAEGARSSLVLILGVLAGELLLILVVARRQIPQAWYDLAALEGVSRLGQFRLISLPLMAPIIALLAARDFAMTFQTSFIPAQIVTKGGPQFMSTMLPQYVYENSFEYLRFGYAATLSSAMLAITLVVLVPQALLLWRWLKRDDNPT